MSDSGQRGDGDVTCLVIGAGPAGLATAACLRRVGVPFLLVDRAGAPGGAYNALYDGIALASPAALDGLPGLPLEAPAEYVDVPTYRSYLQRYAEHSGLEVTKDEISDVSRAGAGFVVRLAAREVRARFVVVATGMWSTPIWPAELDVARGGIPVLHARDWRGPAGIGGEGATLLIVGGATSAIELAEEAARAGAAVTLAARSGVHIAPARLLGRDVHHFVGPLERLPTWLARGYCARRPTLPGTDRGFSRLRAEGRIVVRPKLTALEPIGRASFADGSSDSFDAVVAATGYGFATPFLPREIARAPAGHLVARHNESPTWPGLFVVGAPCANRLDSEFLRGIARDADLVARAIAARL